MKTQRDRLKIVQQVPSYHDILFPPPPPGCGLLSLPLRPRALGRLPSPLQNTHALLDVRLDSVCALHRMEIFPIIVHIPRQQEGSKEAQVGVPRRLAVALNLVPRAWGLQASPVPAPGGQGTGIPTPRSSPDGEGGLASGLAKAAWVLAWVCAVGVWPPYSLYLRL